MSVPRAKITKKSEMASAGAAVVAGIRAALIKLRNDLPAIRARLRPTSCGSEACYSTTDVEAVAGTIRARLREAIPDEALPLRIALEREVATMTSVDEPIPLDGIQPVSLRGPGQGYPASSVDSFFGSYEPAR